MSVSNPPSARAFVATIVTVVLVFPAALVAHATIGDEPSELRATLAAPSEQNIHGETPAELVVSVSRALYERAPVVVVASADDTESHPMAMAAGDQLHAPVLLAGSATSEELTRLEASHVIAIGDPDLDDIADDTITRLRATAAAVKTGITEVRSVEPIRAPARPAPYVVATTSIDENPLALSNAERAGATIIEIPGGDPRGDAVAAKQLRAAADHPLMTLGDDFDEDFAYTRAVTQHAPELPGGGHLLFPDRQLIALYGTPDSGSLGVLGEQGVGESIARAKKIAADYQSFADRPVVPTFEIIATVASAESGDDDDYSREATVDSLRPLVEAAGAAGVYVVLDLQPGRANFLTQAKRYESLLKLPHVGLALDPEWRLESDQRHLRQIGSVNIDEVNAVADWLAALTRKHTLPQKVFVLHQFQARMIADRSQLDTSHPELAPLIHVDGQGSQPDKQGTWRTLRDGAPDVGWGWKNFYDEDEPMLTVEETVEQVEPSPDFVSYQ